MYNQLTLGGQPCMCRCLLINQCDPDNKCKLITQLLGYSINLIIKSICHPHKYCFLIDSFKRRISYDWKPYSGPSNPHVLKSYHILFETTSFNLKLFSLFPITQRFGFGMFVIESMILFAYLVRHFFRFPMMSVPNV